MNRVVVRTLAIAIVLVILFFTILPSPDAVEAGPLCVVCGDRGLADAILNVVMFVPLGLALGFLLSPWAALASGVLLSSGIEMAQVWVPGRHPSLGDVTFNAAGAIVGLLVMLAIGKVLRLRARHALALAFVAALAAGGTLALGVWLLGPAPVDSTVFHGQWTPRFLHMAYYDGELLDASIGAVDLPSTRIPEPEALRDLLGSAAPLEVTVRAGTPPRAVAPLFALAGGADIQVMMVGAHERQLVYRYRTRGNALRMDSPDLRVVDAFATTDPGDTVHIGVTPAAGARSVLITVDGSTTRVRRSPLDTWGLLYWSEAIGMRTRLRRIVGIVWVALLLSPAAFLALAAWHARRRQRAPSR